MPPGIEVFVNYGAMGAFCAFVLVVVWKLGRAIYDQLFSRDPNAKGLIVLKVEASIRQHDKLVEFVDALSEREVHQQALCQDHARTMTQLADLLVQHDVRVAMIGRDVRRVKEVIVLACHLTCAMAAKMCEPEDAHEVRNHCEQIERIIQHTE